MKLISSTPNGEAWRRYAARAAKYVADLRALGLPHEHPERERARRSVRRGIEQARRGSFCSGLSWIDSIYT